jgi:hypothetical protein
MPAAFDDSISALNAPDYEFNAIATAIDLVSASITSHSAPQQTQTAATATDLNLDELTLKAADDWSAAASRTQLAVDCEQGSPRRDVDLAEAIIDEALGDATSWLDND